MYTREPSCILHEGGTLHALSNHRRLRSCGLCPPLLVSSEIFSVRSHTASETLAISMQPPIELRELSSMSSHGCLHCRTRGQSV